MQVVFNTSPLVFLSKLKYIEKAITLFDIIFVPKAVIDEISRKDDKVRTKIKTFINSNEFKIKNTTLQKLYQSLNKKLGQGESEAIALAVELNSDYVILDDSAARKQALSMGLKVKGTLGVIKKLEEEKEIVIDDINWFYKRLYEIGFRVNEDILNEIFRNQSE